MHMGAHACAQRREASIDQAPLAFSSDRDKRLVASMTNLWMDPAVDAASERPVAATAGLWMAEATPGRAEVLTQWKRNHEICPARGLSKVTGGTERISYGGPSFTASGAGGGARHLPAELTIG